MGTIHPPAFPFNFGGFSCGEVVAAGAGGLAGGPVLGSANRPGEWPPQEPPVLLGFLHRAA